MAVINAARLTAIPESVMIVGSQLVTKYRSSKLMKKTSQMSSVNGPRPFAKSCRTTKPFALCSSTVKVAPAGMDAAGSMRRRMAATRSPRSPCTTR